MRIFLLSSKTHNLQGIYNLQIFQAFLPDSFFARELFSPPSLALLAPPPLAV